MLDQPLFWQPSVSPASQIDDWKLLNLERMPDKTVEAIYYKDLLTKRIQMPTITSLQEDFVLDGFLNNLHFHTENTRIQDKEISVNYWPQIPASLNELYITLRVAGYVIDCWKLTDVYMPLQKQTTNRHHVYNLQSYENIEYLPFNIKGVFCYSNSTIIAKLPIAKLPGNVYFTAPALPNKTRLLLNQFQQDYRKFFIYMTKTRHYNNHHDA